MTIMRIFLTFIIILALPTFADQCSFFSIEEANESAVAVIEAEKIYTGMTYEEFSKGAEKNKSILQKWDAYKLEKKSVQFLVRKSYKGDLDISSIVTVDRNTVLDNYYNVGNHFILFLEFSSIKDSYYVDSCVQIDLSRRYAVVNFEAYTYTEFDSLITKIINHKHKNQ